MSGCTGLTATWCPIHGDCVCPCDELNGGDLPAMDDNRCPLHAPTGSHPLEADGAPLNGLIERLANAEATLIGAVHSADIDSAIRQIQAVLRDLRATVQP